MLLAILNLLVLGLLLGPLVGMFGMGSGWMFGMHLAALVWLVALMIVIVAVEALLARRHAG